jgi:hypothetical protein
MPTAVGPNTKGEENLVFGYDLGDVSNSYKGEPTTNLAYLHNARMDNSYNALDLSSYQGQIAALHPGAIQVYNQSGGDISTYWNTGINVGNAGVDWYDTNHAYWVYDEVLKKPVVQIIDRNGIWQAKYMGLGATWDDYGMVPGDQYTLSWLQWNSDGVKRPNVGVYWNSGGSNNFWDGTRDAGASAAGKWERKSTTWTLGNHDTNTSLNIYMYGMYYSRATLRIADVQLEKKSHATTFSFNYNRANTESLLDLTGDTTIDLTNVSFDSNAQMLFDGTNDIISIPAGAIPTIGTSDFTMEFVCKNTKTSSYNHFFSVKDQYHFAFKTSNTSGILYAYRTSELSTTNTIEAYIPSRTSYYHIVLKRSGDSLEIFINGVSQGTKSGWSNVAIENNLYTSYIGWGAGSEYTGGEIPIAKIYNKALTAEEIKSNFNAIKGRFNI